MKRLLLVTGSRALALSDQARAWAFRLLEGTLDPPRSLLTQGPRAWDALLTGGCPGSPDAWAREVAARVGIPWVEYRLDGCRYGKDGKVTRWTEETAPHPHARNQAMVNLLGKQQLAGWQVRVFGLIAPWSPTRGAITTLQKARAAGLPTTDHYAPDGMAARVTAKPSRE